MHREVWDDAGADGQHPVPEGGDGEGDADPFRRKPVVLGMLEHVPEQGCEKISNTMTW